MTFKITCRECSHSIDIVSYLYHPDFCPNCHHQFQLITGIEITGPGVETRPPEKVVLKNLDSGVVFPVETVSKILTGEKTQDRHLWKRRRYQKGQVLFAKTVRVSQGGFARIKVRDCYPQKLKDITPNEAEAEGGYTKSEFIAMFMRKHHIYDPCQKVWVLDFEVLEILEDKMNCSNFPETGEI